VDWDDRPTPRGAGSDETARRATGGSSSPARQAVVARQDGERRDCRSPPARRNVVDALLRSCLTSAHAPMEAAQRRCAGMGDDGHPRGSGFGTEGPTYARMAASGGRRDISEDRIRVHVPPPPPPFTGGYVPGCTAPRGTIRNSEGRCRSRGGRWTGKHPGQAPSRCAEEGAQVRPLPGNGPCTGSGPGADRPGPA